MVEKTQSQAAIPVYLIDANGNPLYPSSSGGGSSGATGPGTAAQASRVTYADDGATVPVRGDVASGSADSGNPVKIGTVSVGANPPAYSYGQRANLVSDENANLRVTQVIREAAFSNNTGAAHTLRSSLQNASILPITATANFNGSGYDQIRKPNGFSRLTATAATGSPTLAKSSAGDLGTFHGLCGGTAVFLQLYNKASAPVIGTDTPVLTFPMVANNPFSAQAGLATTYFSTGIAYAFTTDAAGNTAAGANAVTAFALTYA